MKPAGLVLFFAPLLLFAQGTRADYERAAALSGKASALVKNLPERATWIDATNRFWYRRAVSGGHDFVSVDATTLQKSPAFDHARLATSLSTASRKKIEALKLPFTTFQFTNNSSSIEFTVEDVRWKVTLNDYACQNLGLANTSPRKASLPQNRNQFGDRKVPSPDAKWEAKIVNFNLHVNEIGKQPSKQLSADGLEKNYYDGRSIVWSPDSKKLVAYRIRPGLHRQVAYIESSPEDQVQPKSHMIDYAKPGDTLDWQQPVLFDVASGRQILIDNALFQNPYQLTKPVWWEDSRAFTIEYNQRGHQLYRVIEVDGQKGEARTIINEAPTTFFCYSQKKFRHDLGDGKQMIWMSERDGWNHLYLYNSVTGKVINQITKGNWPVRGVESVDDQRKHIYFRASGMYPGRDPYFVHYYRINFDGTGLVPLTEADANHSVSLSADSLYYVDTYSRLDLPPVSELRSTSDPKMVQWIERGDIDELLKSGWRAPEVFTASGRDGKTEIWGIIVRPSNFSAGKKYPVIEYIYAGPQDSFVPKSFSPYTSMQALAELGFIVVQVDGMGTSNRSKSFHDVAWRNLADAGFPDRILWHKAVAAKYSYYDISKVGIYGHSAGGQNAMGALLFHPEFYKVAVSSCGCHDNRMDKIWWNEQWMGWPLGEQYVACSNVENAGKLQGKLLLSVGELDNNVDPSSTFQVVNALVKAKKSFEFVLLPGQGHSNGGVYGDRTRNDFFVHHLLGLEPPDWNTSEKP